MCQLFSTSEFKLLFTKTPPRAQRCSQPQASIASIPQWVRHDMEEGSQPSRHGSAMLITPLPCLSLSDSLHRVTPSSPHVPSQCHWVGLCQESRSPCTQPWAARMVLAGIPLAITCQWQAASGSYGVEMSACRSPSAAGKGKPEQSAAFYQEEFKGNLPADRSSSCKEILLPPYTIPCLLFFFLYNDSNVLINLGWAWKPEWEE